MAAIDREAEERGCYCGTASHGPGDPPPGFCGTCSVCGRPGHMRHHPGAPVTGAWCDAHFRRLLLLHPLAPTGRRVWQVGGLLLMVGIFWLLRRC